MCTLCLCDMGELHDEWLRAVSVVVTPESCAEVQAVATPVSAGVTTQVAQDLALAAAAAVAEAA